MARQSKLTASQWETIIQLKANGFTYQQLSDKYGVSKQAINARLTTKPENISSQSDISDADCYSAAKQVVVSHFVNEHINISNSILGLQRRNITALIKLQHSLDQHLAEEDLSISQLEQMTNISKNITNQIMQLSKIYGLEDLSHKLNELKVKDLSSQSTKTNPITIIFKEASLPEYHDERAKFFEQDAQQRCSI
jgi:hypothetical protein